MGTSKITIDPNTDLTKAIYEQVISNEGVKFDQGKNRLELIPPEAIFALGSVLTFGATKYADRNWEKGMKWSRVFGAAMRHLWNWWWRKDKDDETNLSHLWHAFCCIAFLITYEARKIGEDDRA